VRSSATVRSSSPPPPSQISLPAELLTMATSLVCVRFGSNSQRHMSAIPESSPPEFACPGNYVAPQPSSLRCAKCGRPLDVKDARYTPTGYVCPYYVKARVATFYNAGFVHYLVVGAL